MRNLTTRLVLALALVLSTGAAYAADIYVTTVTHCKDNGSCVETTTVYTLDAWGNLKVISQKTRVFQRTDEVK